MEVKINTGNKTTGIDVLDCELNVQFPGGGTLVRLYAHDYKDHKRSVNVYLRMDTIRQIVAAADAASDNMLHPLIGRPV